MSGYRSSAYRESVRQQKIRAYYRKKESAALIPENENVFRPRISPDAVVIIRLKGHPQMQFSSYRTPWSGWTISPTLAGQKIQQAMIGYGATP